MPGTGFFGEMIATLGRNKLRTFLTGFSIAWGIFMLIVLLGLGTGIQNTVMRDMGAETENYIYVGTQATTIPYDGMPVGRYVTFDWKTVDMLYQNVPQILHIVPVVNKQVVVSHGEEYMSTNFNGATEQLAPVVGIRIKDGAGRFINEIDERESRKVAVLHPEHQRVLFRGEDPVGRDIVAGGLVYKVIGVYGSSDTFDNTDPPIYIPLSTARILYDNNPWGYFGLDISVAPTASLKESEALTKRIRTQLAKFLRFHPDDPGAVYIWNKAEDMRHARKAFGLFEVFLFVIGLASMVAGIVGVGNIMYVTVRERTREIGIRKAIGASPGSILRMVITEAVFITAVAGYVGILSGIVAVEIADRVFASKAAGSELSLITDPAVSPGIVLGATLLLIAAGVVAGMIPALKATRIKPVEAMKAE